MRAKQGSLLAYLTSTVPRYVPSDTPLPDSSRTVLAQVYKNSQFLNPCGGGVFGFVGRELPHLGPIHGEVLGLANLDSAEGLSVGGLLEGGVGPLAVGGEAMYSFSEGKVSLSWVGFASRSFRGQAEGPRQRGFAGVREGAKMDAVFGGAMVDPEKGEFGGYVSVGVFGGGAYVSYTCH